jgi:hypothetical protein
MGKMSDDCKECEGDGTICLNCHSAITSCECGPNAEPCTCDVCDGSGRAITEREEDAEVQAILDTSDADALAGRWPVTRRMTAKRN